MCPQPMKANTHCLKDPKKMMRPEQKTEVKLETLKMNELRIRNKRKHYFRIEDERT